MAYKEDLIYYKKQCEEQTEYIKEQQNDKKLLQTEIDDLKLENSLLKHSIDEKNEIIFGLTEENEKLKKAIEILNNKMPIQFLGYNKYGAKPYEIISNGFVIGLDQQEYELLKEVLGK